MSPVRMGKVEAAGRLALAWYEAFNRDDLEGLLALAGEGFRFEPEDAGPGVRFLAGKEAFRAAYRDFRRDHPGVRVEVEEIRGSVLGCTVLWRRTWAGDAAGGRGPQELRGVDLFSLGGGLVSELRSYAKVPSAPSSRSFRAAQVQNEDKAGIGQLFTAEGIRTRLRVSLEKRGSLKKEFP